MNLPQDRIPVIPLMGAPGARLTGTKLRQNLTDAETQFSSLMALVDRFSPDAVFPFMDLTVEAEAVGLPIEFPQNEPPSVREHPVKNRKDLDALSSCRRGIGGRMPVFLKTIEKLSRGSGIVTGAYVIGPLTLAGELIGVSELAVASLKNPEFVDEAIRFTSSVVREYALAERDAGADILAVLEPTSVIFSPEQFDKLCAAHFVRLQESFGRRIVLHVCGNTTHLLTKMAATGALGLSLDSLVDFAHASAVLPAGMFLIGNINPVEVFLKESPSVMEEEVAHLLRKVSGRKEFILSSGCDLPADVPFENIERFMAVGKELGR